MRLGVVTVGQTPRVDLTPELSALLPGVELVERGVLDNCTSEQIASFAPSDDDHALTTRLADGGATVIGETAVMRRLPGILATLEAEVDAILLACTGPFPPMQLSKPFFVPDRIIAHAVAAAAPYGAPVGILAPLPEQESDTLQKFRTVLGEDAPVVVRACSPYTDETKRMREAARELAAGGARLIAMDCFGYTAAMRAIVAEETGLPVIVARSIAARLAAETLGTAPVADGAR